MEDVTQLPPDFERALSETISPRINERSDKPSPAQAQGVIIEGVDDLPQPTQDEPEEDDVVDDEVEMDDGPIAAPPAEDDEEEDEDDEPAMPNVEEKKPEPKPLSPEEEHKEKLKVLQQIAAFTSEGYPPMQQPMFNLSLEQLRQILQNQINSHTEALTVTLFTTGYASVIRLIENINEHWEPVHRVTPFKLKGAGDAMFAASPRLRQPFREIVQKCGHSETIEKMAPFLTLGIVTMQVLAEVNRMNNAKERRAKKKKREVPRERPIQPDGILADEKEEKKKKKVDDDSDDGDFDQDEFPDPDDLVSELEAQIPLPTPPSSNETAPQAKKYDIKLVPAKP